MAREKKNESTLTLEAKLAQAVIPVWEWPYKVPENWCWTTVGHLCSFVGGGTPDKANPAYWNGNIPWASVKDIKGDRLYDTIDHITQDGLERSASNLCKKNELILVTRIEPGKAIISETVTAINQDLKVVKSKLSADFLYRYFQTFQRKFEEKASGSTVKGITVPNVQRTAFPLPPLAEQQRIVDRIESLFAKLDEAKEKAQSVLDSFETRKAAILHKAFTGELTAKWRAEHGVGMDSWQSETLQSVCSMKITDGTHKTPTYCDADIGVPFISAKDVTGEAICWDKIKYIVPELHEELYARLAPQLDDILLAKNGTTGVAAIVDVDKVFDLYVTLAVLRPDKSKILPRYLLRIVNSPVCKNQFDEHLTGIGVPNLHLRDIKEVVIQVPSLAEQTAIIQVVDSIMDKEQQAKEAAETVLDQINLLKKSILARAFRGELGTNDPAEESAVELLKNVIMQNND